MFVRNAWYVAAWADEIGERPFARRILNEPIVLFRDASGTVAAIEDRCCHRGTPLAFGRVVAEGLECGYHGLIFDAAGKCVLVPGGHLVPPRRARAQLSDRREKSVRMDLDGRSGARRLLNCI
jgi:phenylpropionate dioxygenase-like ring-hydroxylating dioxygenase large terminal subunit